jgi:hypothetical protein
VLDVGGGGLLVDLVMQSAGLAIPMSELIRANYDQFIDVVDPDMMPVRAQLALAILQTVIEPGDALALAGSANPAKNVLLLEAFSDEVVPNPSTEALARAWGASQVTLAMRSRPVQTVMLPMAAAPFTASPLHALVELDPATHGMFTAQRGERDYVPGFPPFVRQNPPTPVDNPIEIAHALAIGFIDGYRQSGAPTVVDPTR